MVIEELVIDLINALTIDERREILKGIQSNNNNIEVWRSVKSRITEKNFEYKLLSQNYTHEEFNNCIQNLLEIEDTTIIEELKELVKQSEWYKILLEIEEYTDKNKDINHINKPDISLTMYCFVEWAMDKIVDVINQLDTIEVDSKVVNYIRENFYAELLNIASKTLVYEFNKNKKQCKEKYTICDFVNEQFGSFYRTIMFFKEYPVLLRRVTLKIDYISKAMILMLRRIDAKMDNILLSIAGIKSRKITEITLGVGDTHSKGKNVVILKFGDKKVVYKPHQCEYQKHYNEVLMWINKESDLLPFYITQDYYDEDFSINEYIEDDCCVEETQIQRYYTRMGQQIALLYLLGATDMHCENIIAKSEYPIIIDHETFYYNSHFSLGLERDIFDEVQEEINTSIVNTGILPMYVKGYDFGGLAKRRGDEKVKFWVFVNKDDENLSFEERDVYLQENKNLPRLEQKTIGFVDYKREIVEGFNKAVDFFVKNVNEIERILNGISNLKVRIVLRATQNYSELYQYISHPKYMCDMLSLERLLENLWMEYGGSSQQFKYEVMDAHNCDIPIFYTVVGEKALYASNGDKIENYFSCTALEIYLERVRNLKMNFSNQLILLKKYLGLMENENYNWYLSASQRIKHTYREVENNFINIQNVICDINEYIYDRVLFRDNTMTWYEIREGREMLVASSDYIDGTTGLATYLSDCWDKNISVNSKLQKMIGSAVEMVMQKKKYTTYKKNTSYCGLVSNLNLLIRCYKKTSNITYSENIENMVMFFDEFRRENIEKITIFELASNIEIFARAFMITKDFKIQSLLEECGIELIKKIQIQGIAATNSAAMLNVGNVLNAFCLLSRVSCMEEFKIYQNSLLEYITNENNWIEDGFGINGSYVTMEDGNLQRFGEKIIEIYENIKEPKILNIIKRIGKIVLDKEEYTNDTFFDGTASTLSFLLSYLNVNKEKRIQTKVEYLIREVLWGYRINGRPRIYNSVSLPSLGIDKGYVGLAHVLLRYLHSDINTLLV